MHAAKLILIPLVALCLFGTANAQIKEPTQASQVYGFGDGSETFELWSTNAANGDPHSLLKFENSEEIWLVSQHLGRRGAVLYRNDMGRIVFRENLVGGATLYPTPDSKGVPVWREGQGLIASPIAGISTTDSDTPVTVEEWGRAYAYAGTKNTTNADTISEIDNRIEFHGWPEKDTDYRIAMGNHLSGFLAEYPQDEIDRIVVKIGDKPELAHDQSSLTIWVNPSLGYAGRPSSERILQNIKTSRG